MTISKEELEETLEELRTHKGRHTELVSVYVPSGHNVNSVQKQLGTERSTAKNIKSTGTRKNVIDALDKISRELKNFKKTPENGMAVFCGNVSQTEGQQDLQTWIVEPPLPVDVRLYRCDKEFVLKDLEEMLAVSEVFGLLVMDRKEATIGLLEGKRIEVLQKMTSGVPSKVRAGGQSSQRFHRITEGMTREFYKRIAEEMKKVFFEMEKLKGILVGGPIPTKDEFLDGDYLVTRLKEKVLGRIDVGDADESGLHELLEKSSELLQNQEMVHEKKILEKFFDTLGSRPEMAVYGEDGIRKALERGAVDTLIISKDVDSKLIGDLTDAAESTGSKTEIVSLETEEGRQFRNLSGMGAILRFRTG